MDNLNEIEQNSFESANMSDNNYITAVESFTRLGISTGSYEENFLCTTAGEDSLQEPLNLVMRRGKVPFRRTKSAPMTSTPINRIKDLFEDPKKCTSMVEKFSKVTLQESIIEACKKGLEISNGNETRRRKKSSEYPTLFTKDDALAIRTTVSKGFLPESKNNGLKLYYQSTMPKTKIKRVGLRL